jgi:uncharacterized protein (TIGR00299 family) protein
MIVYFDCFAGASGDMLLGALVDAGLDLAALSSALAGLPLPRWRIRAESVQRGTLGATQIHVESEEERPPHRGLPAVLQIIEQAGLPEGATAQARAIFEALAESEARVHRVPIEQIHFHEVGAADAILDVCGVVTGLALLGISEVFCSPLPVGRGMVSSAHGPLPLPAPATLELLARVQAPTLPHPAQIELVTPTGAAILTTLARFERPPMRPTGVGYGAGSRSTPEPNVLRVILGEPFGQAHDDMAVETLTVIECNIDDMNPQWYGHLFSRLLECGALDVTATPVLMKKGRPGQTLQALCPPSAVPHIIEVLLVESTTLGVRQYEVLRHAAGRSSVLVQTAYGPISVKLRLVNGVANQATPEYDDCVRVATTQGIPLAAVTRAAILAAEPLLGEP